MDFLYYSGEGKLMNLTTFSHIVVNESHDSSLVLHCVEKFIIFEIVNLMKRKRLNNHANAMLFYKSKQIKDRMVNKYNNFKS